MPGALSSLEAALAIAAAPAALPRTLRRALNRGLGDRLAARTGLSRRLSGRVSRRLARGLARGLARAAPPATIAVRAMTLFATTVIAVIRRIGQGAAAADQGRRGRQEHQPIHLELPSSLALHPRARVSHVTNMPHEPMLNASLPILQDFGESPGRSRPQ